MNVSPPVRKTVWGPLETREDYDDAIRRSGQPFGVDMSGPACEFRKDWPCDKTMYQMMGVAAHNGIDLPVVTGTEIYASHSGTVQQVSDDVSAGIGVVIWDPVQNIKTLYWHLKSHSVKLGDSVECGEQIALSDNTGYSKGPHLHWGLKLTNEKGVTINRDNGYDGAIDPTPYIVFTNTETMTKEQVEKLYKAIFHREPDTDFWVGHTVDEFLTAVLEGEEFNFMDALVKAARNV